MVLLLSGLVNCSETTPDDPCKFITVSITVHNQTDFDMGIQSIIFGCQVEANLSGNFEQGILVESEQSGTYETGTWGADSILFNLRDLNAEGAITHQITKDISDTLRQFTITIYL